MALTLDYRPLKFQDVVNQSHIIDILQAQVQKDNLNNNYLFFGPRGTGKTTTARLLTRVANCLDPVDNSPCNECENCKAILEEKTLDFVEIDAASHTGVDNIRQEILEKANYKPNQLKKKVYVIDEVHMLSKGAFNALLKIMEEPPEYLMFILATTEINKVPETIISRSQVFNFKKLSVDDIVGRLEYIADNENIQYTKDGLDLLARNCDGALRDAVKYLEQISVLGKVDSDNVVKFMGVAPDKQIKQFIDSIQSFQVKHTFEYLQNFQQSGIDLTNFAKQVLIYIDNHFMDNVEFFANIANLFKDIYQDTKSYPLPIVVYKTHLYKYFEKNKKSIDGDLESIFQNVKLTSKQTSNPGKSANKKVKANKQNSNSKENKTGKKETFKDNQKSKTKSQKKEKSKKPKEIKKNKKTSKETQKTEKNSKETKKSQKTTSGSNSKGDINVDAQEILEKVIKQTEQLTLRKALEKYVHIQNISDSVVELIIISKMQHKLLSKKAKMNRLNELFSNVLDSEINVNLKYISKKDFMKLDLE